MAINLKGRSLLTLKDFTAREIQYLLELSADLKAKKRAGIRGDLLAGKNVALIFEKASTRTRCAFTVACIDEGAHPEFLGKNDIHLGKKEDIQDTARVLGRMFDGIQFRGFSQKTVEDLVKWSGVPVWNGLTDAYHPTQALADILTLQEAFGRVKGLKLVFVGDGRNNVAISLMIICAKLGVNFTICSPDSLQPDEGIFGEMVALGFENNCEILLESDPMKAVKGADAVYTDVWVSMGEEDKVAEREAMLMPYQVNKGMMDASGKKGTIFLHCLPAIKGKEVTEEVFESANSLVFDEAENRLHTIKAVMVATLGS